MYIFAYLVSSLCCAVRVASEVMLRKSNNYSFAHPIYHFENQLPDNKFCVIVLFADRTLIMNRTNVVNTYVRVYIYQYPLSGMSETVTCDLFQRKA